MENEINPMWRPRDEPIQGGGSAFIHPCQVCGSSLAFYGVGVSLLEGKPGNWFCREHSVDKLQTFAPSSPKSQPASESPPPPEPKQGDLF
jgi:hypothetical protein